MMKLSNFSAAALCMLSLCVCAVSSPQKPPMGFSSWNFAGGSFPRETNAMSIADAMVSRGLKDAGYTYLMAFDGWWWTLEKGSRGANGEIVADADRWPHGIKYVCDYIHSKGLKVAGYSDIGAQGYGDGSGRQWGGYPYYQKDADQFAAWGWDYIKIDDCFAGGGKSKENAYAEFCGALRNNASKRPICLSLSTPSTHTSADFGRKVANMWRTSNDINAPGWASFTRSCNLCFDSSEEFWYNQAPGTWNDIDMMVIGIKDLTDAQNKTLFNMWAIRGAPLLIGCDVRNVPQSIIDILTNREVIAIDQDPLCAQGRKVREDMPNVQVYCKPLKSFTSGERAVLLVNRSDASSDITVRSSDLDLQDTRFKVRDLNAKSDLGVFTNSYTAKAVGPGDSVLLKVTGERCDFSRPRDYEAESAYNTSEGTVRHHAYKSGFSSYAYVDGIGKGAGNYLQFNKIAVPKAGDYRVKLAYASGGDSETIDDADTRVTYGPAWSIFNEGGYYADATHYTTGAGAWCEFEFTGNAITWLCKKCPNRGKTEVYIDGKQDATVDCYDTAGPYQTEVYTKSGLALGPHTIKIVTTGTKNASSTDAMVDIDAFRVLTDASAPKSVMVSVNGGKAFSLKLPSTGGENSVGAVETKLKFKEGENTVRLFHDSKLVPVIDKLTVLTSNPSPASSVKYVGVDEKTGGDLAVKSSDIHSIYGASANIPEGIVTRYRHGEWDSYFSQGSDESGLGLKTFSTSPDDHRALIKPGGAERATSCIFHKSNFTVDVDLQNRAPYEVTFYLLDYDRASRVTKIEAFDGGTNALIDTQLISDFGDGKYVIYKATGRVKFKFTCVSGPGVVLSGLFMSQSTESEYWQLLKKTNK